MSTELFLWVDPAPYGEHRQHPGLVPVGPGAQAAPHHAPPGRLCHPQVAIDTVGRRRVGLRPPFGASGAPRAAPVPVPFWWLSSATPWGARWPPSASRASATQRRHCFLHATLPARADSAPRGKTVAPGRSCRSPPLPRASSRYSVPDHLQHSATVASEESLTARSAALFRDGPGDHLAAAGTRAMRPDLLGCGITAEADEFLDVHGRRAHALVMLGWSEYASQRAHLHECVPGIGHDPGRRARPTAADWKRRPPTLRASAWRRRISIGLIHAPFLRPTPVDAPVRGLTSARTAAKVQKADRRGPTTLPWMRYSP